MGLARVQSQYFYPLFWAPTAKDAHSYSGEHVLLLGFNEVHTVNDTSAILGHNLLHATLLMLCCLGAFWAASSMRVVTMVSFLLLVCFWFDFTFVFLWGRLGVVYDSRRLLLLKHPLVLIASFGATTAP